MSGSGSENNLRSIVSCEERQRKFKPQMFFGSQ